MQKFIRIVLFLVAAVSGSTMAAVSDYFVSPEYVAVNLETLKIIDARGYLAYLQGHLPGAVAVNWKSLSHTEGDTSAKGWGNLLDKNALTPKLEALGLNKDDEIIVYADSPGGWGEDGRILWSLKQVGFSNVKIMNGSYSLWQQKGFDTSIKPVLFTDETGLELTQRDDSMSIDTTALFENYADVIIIDTRTPEEYSGAVKYGESRGGHLPGAINLPFTLLMDEMGQLKSDTEIDAILKNYGISRNSRIVTYCTAGIRSAHMAMVLKASGYENVQNYDSSFYRWAALPFTLVN